MQPAPVSISDPNLQRVLFVTHNLNREGAPLFLLDLVADQVKRGAQATVLTPTDGPLRTAFEAAGARVANIDIDSIHAAPDRSGAEAGITALAQQFDFGAYDLVIANTFTTYWGVHAARRAGTKVLLYVHESSIPAGFYLGRMAGGVIQLVEDAFGAADCVAFTTAATRGYHLDYGNPANHRLAPGWIDVGRLDVWSAANPRPLARARFALAPGELLVTNVGTVCDRKGQHIFVRAVDLLWRRHPDLARKTRFVMLGGGNTLFDATLHDLLAQVNRPNLEVHPATADYLPYYTAADVFVCSSYEESSPRVILETMALGTPILSSSVQGIPEQVRDGVEASLVPAGDTWALTKAMADLLQSPEKRARLARAARARVEGEFDSRRLLARHAALAQATAAGEIRA